MSNTRYHSIGLKVKEKQESNPGRQSDDRMGENSRGKANLKRWVLSFERNVETDNELRTGVRREGVPESWSNDRKGPFTQRCSDIWDGQNRWIRWSCRQRVRRKRKTIVKIGRLLNLKRFICKKAQFVIDAFVWLEANVIFWVLL